MDESSIINMLNTTTSDPYMLIYPIINPGFQDLINFFLLLLGFTTVVLAYNTALYPKLIEWLKEKNDIVPVNGAYIVISNIALIICLVGSCLAITLLVLDFNFFHLLECCSVAKILWGIVLVSVVLTTYDVIISTSYMLRR